MTLGLIQMRHLILLKQNLTILDQIIKLPPDTPFHLFTFPFHALPF